MGVGEVFIFKRTNQSIFAKLSLIELEHPDISLECFILSHQKAWYPCSAGGIYMG
jgi:hypothetical protein